MIVLFFLIGIVVGVSITTTAITLRSAHGYFKVELVDPEEDLYCVNMTINKDQNLTKKKCIILHTDPGISHD